MADTAGEQLVQIGSDGEEYYYEVVEEEVEEDDEIEGNWVLGEDGYMYLEVEEVCKVRPLLFSL